MIDKDLIAQIRNQYSESRDFYYARKLRQVKQLQLLNNLNRGDQNIASTLLLSFFNRIMSNLYEDKIQVKFVPNEEMEYKKVETLNKLAVNDFREMDMSLHEYDWVWDTLFFGKGIIETLKFDKKKKLMQPSVINPLAFGSDPFFSDCQHWRYYWKWILKSGYEIKKLIKQGIIDGIESVTEIPNGLEADLWDFKVKRDSAKALTSTGDSSMALNRDTDIYQILEIATTDENGDKIICWVDKGFGKVLMVDKLDLKDEEDGTSKWPIVVKELFRQPHSAVSYSVPDLIEDKHRAKSVLMNLAFIAAKDEANPIYQYVPEKVKDITQLFQRQIQQHIPVEEIDAIKPLATQPALSASLLNFINLLSIEAQDPIGSGITQQLPKSGKETATASALRQQLNDLAQSLQSKVLQIGEKEFWSHWYQRYVNNTKEGDEKIITLTSVKGVSFENINLGDIKTKYPPKIEVYSAKEAEYKELVEKRDMMQIYPQFAQTIDPAGLKNFNKFVFMPKFLRDSSVIDLVIPKTIDEMAAERENDMLNYNMMPDVKETDDHETHLYAHASAKNTSSSITHKYWHEELLAILKKQKMEQEQQQMQQQNQPPPPKIGEDQKNPLEAAVPLKTAIKKVGSKIK